MEIDLLPDEIMLIIFSYITDGTTLAKDIPLVCKRWKRLSRDPAAWAGISVVCPFTYDVPLIQLWLLCRAPALDILDVGSLEHPGLVNSIQRVLVVRRLLSAATVSSDVPSAHISALLDLMWRSRTLLRCLNFTLDDNSLVATDHEGHTTLQVLSQLHKLRSIVLRLDVVDADVAYGGELHRAMPDLQHLVICQTGLPQLTRPAFHDMVRTAAGSLRDLKVRTHWGMHDQALMHSLAACVKLERLDIQGHEIPTLAAVRCVKTLQHVRFHDLCPYKRRPEDDDFQCCLHNLERLCVAELPALMSIVVHIWYSNRPDAEVRAMCDRQQAVLQVLRPGLKVTFSPKKREY